MCLTSKQRNVLQGTTHKLKQVESMVIRIISQSVYVNFSFTILCPMWHCRYESAINNAFICKDLYISTLGLSKLEYNYQE